jgi:hypothetical protein
VPTAAEIAFRDARMADPYWYREPVHAYEVEAHDAYAHVERQRIAEAEARARAELEARRAAARAVRDASRDRVSDVQIAAARDADLVGVIGARVKLRRVGDSWKGLCPFHDEKTPSFVVKPSKGWYCYGCIEGGDAIGFVMRYEAAAFLEAVRMLADENGVAA